MKKILNIAGACILIAGVLFVSSCENNISHALYLIFIQKASGRRCSFSVFYHKRGGGEGIYGYFRKKLEQSKRKL